MMDRGRSSDTPPVPSYSYEVGRDGGEVWEIAAASSDLVIKIKLSGCPWVPSGQAIGDRIVRHLHPLRPQRREPWEKALETATPSSLLGAAIVSFLSRAKLFQQETTVPPKGLLPEHLPSPDDITRFVLGSVRIGSLAPPASTTVLRAVPRQFQRTSPEANHRLVRLDKYIHAAAIECPGRCCCQADSLCLLLTAAEGSSINSGIAASSTCMPPHL